LELGLLLLSFDLLEFLFFLRPFIESLGDLLGFEKLKVPLVAW
jgi:hypothetical protein